MSKLKNKNAITLIALVITIIILLILAGVSIAMLSGQNSILSRGAEAREKTDKSQVEERAKLAYTASLATHNGEVTLEGLQEEIAKEFKPSENVTVVEEGDNYVVKQNAEDAENVKTIITIKKTTTTQVVIGLQIPDALKTAVQNGEIKTVKMTVEGEYTWDEKYYTDDEGQETIELFTGTPKSGLTQDANTAYQYTDTNSKKYYDMTITDWKVLRIDEENNTIDLVPANATTAELTLNGAQGYNNGVRLLNEACSNLYGDEENGITARNINIEDIEELMDSTAIETAKNSGTPTYGNTYTTAYTISGTNYRDSTGAYIKCKTYPSIYGEEAGRRINGDYHGEGYGLSEYNKNSWYERTNGGNKVTTATSIQPKKTSYGMNNSDFSNALGTTNSNLLLPNGSSTKYWVASRDVALNDENCSFCFCYVSGGRPTGFSMFTSKGYTHSYSSPLFPVVSLSSGILTPNQDGTYSYSTN